MRKALLFSAAVAAMALVSCNKEPGNSVRQPVQESTPVEVRVSIQGTLSTKSTGVTYAEESKVNTLQVFVFKDDALEAHRSVNNAFTALVPATAGERSVWAVVNAPDLYAALNVSDSDPMTLSKLKAYMSNLADNSVGNFVMVGNVSQELVDGGNVIINVKRLVSRVSINKISASLKEYREGYSVRVKGIYVINAAANVSYDASVYATAWANPLKHVDASFDGLLYDDLTPAAGEEPIIVKNDKFQKDGADIREHEAWVYDKMILGQYELADGVTRIEDNSYEKEHVFYVYPNKFGISEGATTNYDDTWSERGSILVIEAEMLDDSGNPVDLHPDTDHQTVGYYPIPLPALERNKTYSISEIKITRLPGDVPYHPIETGESQVTITVNDWEIGWEGGTISI